MKTRLFWMNWLVVISVLASLVFVGGTPAPARAAPLMAPVSLSAGVYTQNFDGLPSTGTSATWTNDGTLAGWYSNRTTIIVNNGAGNSGGLYSYGTTSATERALGSLGSGSASLLLYGLRLTNDTEKDITGLYVSFTGEQWRVANTAAHKLEFAYRVGSSLTDVTTGVYTSVPALDFTSPVVSATAAPLDGNLAANRVAISGTIPVTIPAGQDIILRWRDVDNTGADQALAIDDLTVAVPLHVVETSPANQVTSGVALSDNVVITFSEPVNLAADWFALNCTTSGNHTAAVSTNVDGDVVTLDPDVDFQDGETCTVTVYAAKVTPQNAGSAAMTADYSFWFGAGDAAPILIGSKPANGSADVRVDRWVILDFSEPVTVQDGWYTLACSPSETPPVMRLVETLPSASISLEAMTDYVWGDTCTFTVDNTKVLDVDGEPDALTAPLTINYTIVSGPVDSIHAIQGAAHVSPLNGLPVTRVHGVVTAIVPNKGFFLQDVFAPDADTNTSEGIYVFMNRAPAVTVGMEVLVSGTVAEYRPAGATSTDLSITEITNPVVLDVRNDLVSLPSPVVIGEGGRIPPAAVTEDDATAPDFNVETSGTFDADTDGIDFYESLEGMYVQVNEALVVGNKHTSYGELPIVGDMGRQATTVNTIGGVTIADGDQNPERMILDDLIVGLAAIPDIPVGSYFTDPILGVMDYGFGYFKLAMINAPGYAVAGPMLPVAAEANKNQLTIAAFNTENLDPGDGKYALIAAQVVDNMHSPDILALMEVQDNNGAVNDGTVAADTNLANLIAAIVSAGGPTYEYRQINPVNNSDGGETGGNIRVAFLFNAARVGFVDRAGGDSTTAVAVNNVTGVPELSLNPGRIDPTNPAFFDSRKPLAGEFTFMGNKVFVIANHLNSKGGDETQMGWHQPPALVSEVQRKQQADVINAFIDSILAVDANANVVTLGDLNDFQWSAPLKRLDGRLNADDSAGTPVLFNLHNLLPASEQFTYVYTGNSQALDHILVSNHIANLLQKPAEFEVLHLNSWRTYNDPQATSDHDPLLARLDLNTYYTLSGTVLDAGGAPVEGVTITANTGESTTTAADGTYQLVDMLAGTYTLSAAKPGLAFSPASRNVMLGPSATDVDFTALYTINGTVRDAAGIGLAGVTISDNHGGSALTDANGVYTLTTSVLGSYTLSASKATMVFAPASQTVTVGPSQMDVNFTGYYTISGTVISSLGTGLSGVTITDDHGGSTTTNSSGAYTLVAYQVGSYTITAAKSGWTFTPTSRTVTVGPSRTGVDFSPLSSISGVVRDPYGLPVAGVTVKAGGKTVLTNASGAFTVDGLALGEYLLSASKPGYTLSPAGYTVLLSSGPRSGFTFKAFSNSTVYLIGPANNAKVALTGTYTPVTFDWYDVANAASYKVTIKANNRAFKTATVTGSTSQMTLSLPLRMRTTYTWTVTAYNAAGQAIATSTTWKFTPTNLY